VNKRACNAGLLVASVLVMSNARAFTEESIAGTCFAGGSTHMCSESFTAANFVDAVVFAGGQVKVHAFFRGPDYYVEKQLGSDIYWMFPSTWTVTARLTPWQCAYSGVHTAEARHAAHGNREGLPLPTYGPRETLSLHVQHYCDCGGDIHRDIP
jgi:hypothetical protein